MSGVILALDGQGQEEGRMGHRSAHAVLAWSSSSRIIVFYFSSVNEMRMWTCDCDWMVRLMGSLRSAVNMAADLSDSTSRTIQSRPHVHILASLTIEK